MMRPHPDSARNFRDESQASNRTSSARPHSDENSVIERSFGAICGIEEVVTQPNHGGCDVSALIRCTVFAPTKLAC